jgi:hypothetical protein
MDIVDYWVLNPLTHTLSDNIFITPKTLAYMVSADQKQLIKYDGLSFAPIDTIYADLHVYDCEGNHCGVIGSTSEWQIPYSTYFDIPNLIQCAGVGNYNSNLTFQIHGHGNDTVMFGLGMSYPDGHSVRVYFDEIDLTATTCAMVQFSDSINDISLAVDYDGDSTVDIYITPDLVETPPQVPNQVVAVDFAGGNQ